MGHYPRLLLLKQTAPMMSYFVELGIDLAARVGPSTMYTSVRDEVQIGDLRILPAPAYRRQSDLSRLSSWLRYFLKTVWIAFRTNRRTLLFIVAQPPYLPIIGYVRNLLFGQKYVVWVDDVYPDILVRFGRLSHNGLVARLWRWVNRRMYGRASSVFTLGPVMAQTLRNYVPVSPDSRAGIEIIPTWVDSDAFQRGPKDQNPFAIEHGQVDKLTVLYSGNIGMTHDLDTMVEGARRLLEFPDIHFIIVGDGPRWSDLLEIAGELDNLSVLPMQPEEVLPYSLATGEVAVVAIGSGFEGLSMPSKTYYSMAAGSAVLGISRPPNDLEGVIDRFECGINVEPGDVQGFVDAVLKFRNDEEFRERCRRNGRLAAETVFSREVNVERVFKAVSPFLNTG